MMPRWKQRLGGLLMFLIGAGATWWTWDRALQTGQFYLQASLAFPAIAVLGVAAIAFRPPREERSARGEDVAGLKGWHLMTIRWRLILAAALFAGFFNYYLLKIPR